MVSIQLLNLLNLTKVGLEKPECELISSFTDLLSQKWSGGDDVVPQVHCCFPSVALPLLILYKTTGEHISCGSVKDSLLITFSQILTILGKQEESEPSEILTERMTRKMTKPTAISSQEVRNQPYKLKILTRRMAMGVDLAPDHLRDLW